MKVEQAETVETVQFKAAGAFRTPKQSKPKDAKPVAEKAMEVKAELEVETEDFDLCTFSYWDNSDFLKIENTVKFAEASIEEKLTGKNLTDSNVPCGHNLITNFVLINGRLV